MYGYFQLHGRIEIDEGVLSVVCISINIRRTVELDVLYLFQSGVSLLFELEHLF